MSDSFLTFSVTVVQLTFVLSSGLYVCVCFGSMPLSSHPLRLCLVNGRSHATLWVPMIHKYSDSLKLIFGSRCCTFQCHSTVIAAHLLLLSFCPDCGETVDKGDRFFFNYELKSCKCYHLVAPYHAWPRGCEKKKRGSQLLAVMSVQWLIISSLLSSCRTSFLPFTVSFIPFCSIIDMLSIFLISSVLTFSS